MIKRQNTPNHVLYNGLVCTWEGYYDIFLNFRSCLLLKWMNHYCCNAITDLILLCILQAALLARKAELSAKERCSQERDYVAVKAEIEEPVINSCRNCGKSTNCTAGSGATPHNIQNQEPKAAMDAPPVASNRNPKPVKAELVTSEI